MKKYPIILDLETKHTFREFSDPQKLGVTVLALYDYKDSQGRVFTENELSKVFPILENASYVIGYNIRSFDMAVLQAYYPGVLAQFPIFDILEDIKDKIGRRIGLNDVAGATLGKQKTGHGLMAIDYYREGKWDELKKYCMDDVMVTKDLFDFGVKTRNIFYMDTNGKASIEVEWKKYMEESGSGDVALTLPF